MRLSTALVTFAAVLAACTLGACSGGQPEKAAPGALGPGAAPTAPPKPPAPTVLTGSVRLAPGAVLPMYAADDMERRVLTQLQRPTLPEGCSPPKTTDRTPVRATPDGKLVGVMVTVSDFMKAKQRAPRIYDVAIRDCRLTPSLVVAMEGDSLRIRNEINFPFMPGYGKDPVLATLIPGQTKDIVLQEAGVSPIQCGFTAPCGRTDVVVLHHPVYAITGDDGTFRIEDFPADEKVTVSAWHPLFDAAEQVLTLGQGETKSIELVIAPTAKAPAPPTTQSPTPGK